MHWTDRNWVHSFLRWLTIESLKIGQHSTIITKKNCGKQRVGKKSWNFIKEFINNSTIPLLSTSLEVITPKPRFYLKGGCWKIIWCLCYNYLDLHGWQYRRTRSIRSNKTCLVTVYRTSVKGSSYTVHIVGDIPTVIKSVLVNKLYHKNNVKYNSWACRLVSFPFRIWSLSTYWFRSSWRSSSWCFLIQCYQTICFITKWILALENHGSWCSTSIFGRHRIFVTCIN